MIVLFMTKLILFSYFDRYLQNMTLKVIQFIYFSAECKYHKNVKKELIQARMLKTQYNLKPPLLHGNHRTLKKVSISFPFYFYMHKQKVLNFAKHLKINFANSKMNSVFLIIMFFFFFFEVLQLFFLSFSIICLVRHLIYMFLFILYSLLLIIHKSVFKVDDSFLIQLLKSTIMLVFAIGEF